MQDYNLSNETHAEIFLKLSGGNKIVKLEIMMPYLMIFFLASHYHQIEKRKLRFFQMLDPSPQQKKDSQMSIIQGFRNMGLAEEDLYKRTLKYRDVEHFLIDYRSKFPANFSN